MPKFVIKISIFAALSLVLSSCAYTFGYAQRDLPGGFREVAIPVFSNSTREVGIEGEFTNALINQFNRSQVAKVVSSEAAPAVIEGNIVSVKYIENSQIDGNSGKNNINLPRNSVLTIDYRLLAVAELKLRRKSDDRILWQGQVSTERFYTAPQVGLSVVNSANANYNHSARIDLLGNMAKDMMYQAHDQMTENF